MVVFVLAALAAARVARSSERASRLARALAVRSWREAERGRTRWGARTGSSRGPLWSAMEGPCGGAFSRPGGWRLPSTTVFCSPMLTTLSALLYTYAAPNSTP
eukprot:7176232-Pyramimonas_sp.AAC.1